MTVMIDNDPLCRVFREAKKEETESLKRRNEQTRERPQRKFREKIMIYNDIKKIKMRRRRRRRKRRRRVILASCVR